MDPKGKIRLLSYADRLRLDARASIERESQQETSQVLASVKPEPIEQSKSHWDSSTAKPYKFIDDKEWNLVSTIPTNETNVFNNGHSALNVISVIGLQGSGKTDLLNIIAQRAVFPTHTDISRSRNISCLQHATRGIDIFATDDRILLDSQPMLSTSVLDEIMNSHSLAPYTKKSLSCDPATKNFMISLELTTLLIAISDYVIIVNKWHIDVHLLKLIATAVLMIGEDNLRAEIIMFSEDSRVQNLDMKHIVDGCLGAGRVEQYFSNRDDLRRHISTIPTHKREMISKDPTKFACKNWLPYCHKVWEMSIKNSAMFLEYKRLLASHIY